MEIVEPALRPIAVTYTASRAGWEIAAESRNRWTVYPLTLVHVDLPYPIYQTREEWERYGDELYAVYPEYERIGEPS